MSSVHQAPAPRSGRTRSDALPPIPRGWARLLRDEVRKPYYRDLAAFVSRERRRQVVCPPMHLVYAALRLTPFNCVRVVLLGQDPYPGPGQAHGLSFSVAPGTPVPPSLRNIFAELCNDLGIPAARTGSLIPWAEQGVLLLNTVLTVRAHEPGSHRRRGWERFTDAVIGAVGDGRPRVVFMLWGSDAQAKAGLIDLRRHVVIAAAHPSPLSAGRGFLGTRPFSRVNAALRTAGEPEIDWRLPDRSVGCLP
jgi:uracil-DNA glycosylase